MSGARTGLTGHQPGAVQKALGMLEAVAHLGPGATAREIVGLTGVPVATAYRMLNLLVADGYLVRVPDLSGFALGRRTAELAHAAERSAPDATVHDVAGELRRATRLGVHVASFARGRVRLVDPDSEHEIVAVGMIDRAPHANALGKVLLAHHPGSRSGLELRRLTVHTIVDRHLLAEELAGVRAAGCAVEAEEARLGRAALAAPIRGADDEVTGGLYLVGPTATIRRDDPGLRRFVIDGAAQLAGLV